MVELGEQIANNVATVLKDCFDESQENFMIDFDSLELDWSGKHAT